MRSWNRMVDLTKLYYGFWVTVAFLGLLEGGIIIVFLWKLSR